MSVKTIGCTAYGQLVKCDGCLYADSPKDCLIFRRATNARVEEEYT